jgi:hypothetical protein
MSIDTLLLPTLRCRQKHGLTARTVTMHWFHLPPRYFRLPHNRRYHPSLPPPNSSSQHKKEFPETCQPKRLRRYTRQCVNLLSKCKRWRWTRKLPVLYPRAVSPPVDDRHARSWTTIGKDIPSAVQMTRSPFRSTGLIHQGNVRAHRSVTRCDVTKTAYGQCVCEHVGHYRSPRIVPT